MSAKRWATLAVTSAAAAGLVVLTPAAPASAAVRRCGYISCTWYFNKAETQDLGNGGSVPVALLGGPVGIAVAAIGNATIQIASNHGLCLKVQVSLPAKTTWGWSPC